MVQWKCTAQVKNDVKTATIVALSSNPERPDHARILTA